MKKQYDVVIIGAGVVGSAIARELSRYKLSIAVLENNLEVCNETSGRNSAVVHGGFASVRNDVIRVITDSAVDTEEKSDTENED